MFRGVHSKWLTAIQSFYSLWWRTIKLTLVKKDQQVLRYRWNNHVLITYYVTMTTAKQSFFRTLWLAMMHHHTKYGYCAKFCYKRLSCSEHNFCTKEGRQADSNTPPNYDLIYKFSHQFWCLALSVWNMVQTCKAQQIIKHCYCIRSVTLSTNRILCETLQDSWLTCSARQLDAQANAGQYMGVLFLTWIKNMQQVFLMSPNK